MEPETQRLTTPLTAEQMKAAVQRFADEAVNQGDFSGVGEIYSEDWLDHDNGHPDLGRGAEAAKREIALYRKAFPDLHHEIQEFVVDGNVIVHRWKTTGTHLGEFLGVPPTKKRLRTEGISLERFGPNGKIVETYNVNDRMSLVQQLGLKGLFWAVVKRSWRIDKQR